VVAAAQMGTFVGEHGRDSIGCQVSGQPVGGDHRAWPSGQAEGQWAVMGQPQRHGGSVVHACGQPQQGQMFTASLGSTPAYANADHHQPGGSRQQHDEPHQSAEFFHVRW
jgi:hypothetical protein